MALAVSLGDPAGIGPECIVGAWLNREAEKLPAFFVVHGAGVLEAAAKATGHPVPVTRIDDPADCEQVFGEAMPVLGTHDAPYRPGAPEMPGAELALASLTEATAMACQKRADGIVTCPIAKSRLAEVGFSQPGQTEFLAEQCGLRHEDAVMMLAGPSLRTVPLTIHIALSDVPSQLSTGLILRRARIVAAALRRDFGIAKPRIAVTGLNPHAGEQGRFGDEEAHVIIPAIKRLRGEGMAVTGPHPADALFAPHERAGYDAALCIYHDQALIPIKALDFDSGVTVTLGLPIVRTSPDHGTAFGIAGKGVARPWATIAAIRMAGECAARRRSA